GALNKIPTFVNLKLVVIEKACPWSSICNVWSISSPICYFLCILECWKQHCSFFELLTKKRKRRKNQILIQLHHLVAIGLNILCLFIIILNKVKYDKITKLIKYHINSPFLFAFFSLFAYNQS
ncbi:hypothetical protein VIGAN_09053100, partial [Vigna angularis var. angularis]